ATSWSSTTSIPTVEEYRSDPLGHLYWSRTRNPETGRAPAMLYTYGPGGSAVVEKAAHQLHSPQNPWRPDTTYARLDQAGNVRASGQRTYGPTSSGDGNQFTRVSASAAQHYYGADEKLRFLQKYDWNEQRQNGTFDEYRYDALGRRVLQRMRRDSLCYGAGADCTSAIERYVWFGDQLLYEIRAQGGDNVTSAGLESDGAGGDEFGRVGYTHAAGIDAPLSVIRQGYVSGSIAIFPHSDYRGAYHAGSVSNGAAYNCGPSDPCLYVVWPKKYWGGYWDGGDPAAGDWAGSLIRGQQDISGLMYRRNRYYNPQTGQFTQSDPIGFAGGLNAYGFGAGDPVSYSDPYGLCPPEDTNNGPWCSSGGYKLMRAAGVDHETADRVAEALYVDPGEAWLEAKVGAAPGLFAARGVRVGMGAASRTFRSSGAGTNLTRSTVIGGRTFRVNSGHGFNRAHRSGDLRSTGLQMDQVDNAILDDLSAFRSAGGAIPAAGSKGGYLQRTIQVDGVNVTYRAVETSRETIVSTYFP
ncbi:MAG TPA: RHS repeat-associated core domain-containing protein, partial [Longimicrobium sp.]|nr:RHS repeat-associated core domain-containing protein [Longimicrobium sp.]